jgi:biotin---protein ligase
MIPSLSSEVLASLQDIVTVENGEEYIKDDNDTFHIETPSAWSPGSANVSLSRSGDMVTDSDYNEDRILNYSTIVKRIVVHDKEHPASKETPYFNHHAFFSNLSNYQSESSEEEDEFGVHLLYGEVVTSTNTILEKYAYVPLKTLRDRKTVSDRNRNTQLLRRLPHGFTATATIQVAGRGRGSNVWVSPAGSLIFSTVIRHPISLLAHAPVIFLQYLAALAIVEGIKSYDVGFEKLPIKLKWPNDVCKFCCF